MLDKIPKQLIFRILFCDFLYIWAPSHYSVFVFSHSVLCVSVTFGFFGFYTIILTGAQNILLWLLVHYGCCTWPTVCYSRHAKVVVAIFIVNFINILYIYFFLYVPKFSVTCCSCAESFTYSVYQKMFCFVKYVLLLLMPHCCVFVMYSVVLVILLLLHTGNN